MPAAAKNTVLVTGATGTTGSALLTALSNRGVNVRAMVRHERDAARLPASGASVVVADFNDPQSLSAALKDVDSAFLVTPSSMEAQAQQYRFAELAAAARLKHLVKLSQFAADEASTVRFLRYHAAVEKRIRELDIPYTFLRPNLFFQSLLAFKSLIASEGHFFAPVGSARVSAVDVRDIARVAAAVLTQPGHIGKTYTVTGPAAITHAEIAAAISAATGRNVSFVDVPPKEFTAALRKMGIPPWQVGGLVEDYAHYSWGEAAEVHPTVQAVAGTEAIDVRTFAKDYAQAFVA